MFFIRTSQLTVRTEYLASHPFESSHPAHARVHVSTARAVPRYSRSSIRVPDDTKASWSVGARDFSQRERRERARERLSGTNDGKSVVPSNARLTRVKPRAGHPPVCRSSRAVDPSIPHFARTSLRLYPRTSMCPPSPRHPPSRTLPPTFPRESHLAGSILLHSCDVDFLQKTTNYISGMHAV